MVESGYIANTLQHLRSANEPVGSVPLKTWWNPAIGREGYWQRAGRLTEWSENARDIWSGTLADGHLSV